MAPPVELIASYWTIAGSFPGIAPEYSRFAFEDRVKAASAAGFRGMGFWHTDLEHTQESLSLQEMRRILDDHGIAHVEVEFLTDWFLEGERKRQSDARKQMLFRAAEVLKAKYVKVGDFHRERCPMQRLIESFAQLCAEAREHGTAIAFEFMSAAMIDNLQDSIAMIEGSGAKNGGVIVDLWHVVNKGIPYEEVAHMPLPFLMGVELNDASVDAAAKPGERSGDPRRYCGEGDFDIAGFVESVRHSGYSGRWGVEVIDREFQHTSLQELATRAYTSSIRYLP